MDHSLDPHCVVVVDVDVDSDGYVWSSAII